MKITNFLIMFLLILGVQAKSQIDKTKFVYQKPLFDFEYKKPVFKLENEQQTNERRFLRFSVITGYREGVKPINGIINSDVYNDDKSETSRYCMYNLSIQDMLTNGTKVDQVILNVKDPSKYHYDPKYGPKLEWLRKNGYCYEIMFPSAVFSMNTMEMIKVDCASQFHVKVLTEKRMTTALHRYGLKPEEENREVDVYIITEEN